MHTTDASGELDLTKRLKKISLRKAITKPQVAQPLMDATVSFTDHRHINVLTRPMSVPFILLLDVIRPAPPVSVQPFMQISEWQIATTRANEFVLRGRLQDGRVRTTTEISEVHSCQGLVVTSSGRIYELIGEPSFMVMPEWAATSETESCDGVRFDAEATQALKKKIQEPTH